MDNGKIFTSTLRLYKENEVHLQAYKHLKNINKDIFTSQNDYIAEAVVYFENFMRQKQNVQESDDLFMKITRNEERFLALSKRAVKEVLESSSFTGGNLTGNELTAGEDTETDKENDSMGEEPDRLMSFYDQFDEEG